MVFNKIVLHLTDDKASIDLRGPFSLKKTQLSMMSKILDFNLSWEWLNKGYTNKSYDDIDFGETL